MTLVQILTSLVQTKIDMYIYIKDEYTYIIYTYLYKMDKLMYLYDTGANFHINRPYEDMTRLIHTTHSYIYMTHSSHTRLIHAYVYVWMRHVMS